MVKTRLIDYPPPAPINPNGQWRPSFRDDSIDDMTGSLATEPPPRRRWLVPLVAVVGVLTAAIGGATIGYAILGAASAAQVSPSATGKVATIQQYAGVVNESAVSIRATWATSYNRSCVIYVNPQVVCPIMAMTLRTRADILLIELRISTRNFGPPPAEIEALVADTIAAAEKLKATIPDSYVEIDGKDVYFGITDLLGVFDRWEPYI